MTPAISLLRITISALVFSFTFTLAAHAGSPAWAITDATLTKGPGHAYGKAGTVIAGSAVSVERCTRFWCQVITDDYLGWMSQDKISFGQEPRGPLTGAHFERKAGGPGTVCLFTGKGFSGEQLCAESGFVIRDLALIGKDNQFSSATIEGSVSLMVCRDAYFHSYCEHVTADRTDFGQLLTRKVSSIRVY